MAVVQPTREHLPGIGAALLVAFVASGIATVTPRAIGPVPTAVVCGAMAASMGRATRLAAGVRFVTTRVLRAGIVMLGAELSLQEVASIGARAALFVTSTILLGLTVGMWMGRLAHLDLTTRTLVSVGSAICGNTAIMASAPVVEARDRHVGVAVTGITLWGTLALLVYPMVGRWLNMSDLQFGLWVGLAVQDTSQVVAAGAAFSDGALDVATVVKLLRNAALILVLPVLAMIRRGHSTARSGAMRRGIPVFVVGFLLMAGLRTSGVISPSVGESTAEVGSLAILVAVAGLGLSISIRDLRRGSGRGIWVAGVTALVLGVVGLGLALTAGPSIN